jgi:excisionase family DNA binding protein
MCNQCRHTDFPPKLYTAAEAAAILGVSLKTLHKWLDAGILPHTRLGPAARLIRIRAQDIETFLRSGLQVHHKSEDNPRTTLLEHEEDEAKSDAQVLDRHPSSPLTRR